MNTVSEKLNELFLLEQKAQKMELINEEVALKLYREIFESYTPKISRTYESTIRLLEKRQCYDEALVICDRAISGISANEVSGVLSKFEIIKSRLEDKNKQTPVAPTSERAPKRRKFGKKHLIALLLTLIFVVFLIKYTVPERELNVNLEGKESLDGGEVLFPDKEKEDPTKTYPITEDMMAVAYGSISKLIEVADAEVIPQEDTLGIVIIVKGGTDEDRSKEIAELYLKSLSGAAAATYDDLTGPTDESLGTLYDFYELIVVVGTTKDEKDAIAKGTKVKGAGKIYWRKIESDT
ncbi:hypothetical protein ACR6HW_05395 [Fusibacter sp. JL298sf-3]